jgi:hypothetical protein
MASARSLLRSPKIPLEQQASNYFAANFILVPRIGGTAVGYMEYLLPMLESEGQDSALRHAFNACAAAALGNRRNANRQDCAALALREENRALQKTFENLQDPSTFRSDGTLAAVLLLILFEVCLELPCLVLRPFRLICVGRNHGTSSSTDKSKHTEHNGAKRGRATCLAIAH